MVNQARASEKAPESPVDEEPSDVPLSVCVITLNEEGNIRRCLSSVQWAAELLVVDSGSEDRTREIAESMGATVLHRDWTGHVDQHRFATERARHDWILALDADEEVSSRLATSIRERFRDGPPPTDTSFEINRLVHHLGTWIRYGSWHPDWIVRLYNRTTAEWSGMDPHSHVEPAARVSRLEGPLYHYPYRDLHDHLARINRYTDTMARELDDEGVTGGPFKGLLHGAAAWFKDYLLKGGFRGGRTGLLNSILHAFYTFMKYVKLWERQEDFETNDPAPPPSQETSG